MSTFSVPIVKLDPNDVIRHPNADSLSITHVFGYPLIIRTEDWMDQDGNLKYEHAAYVPVDSVVPVADSRFSFLDNPRIRAKRLRGVFSQGLLIPAPDGASEGEDVAGLLGIEKYEPPVQVHMNTDTAPAPECLCPAYTEIGHLRRYHTLFWTGEEVVCHEKIHGANARYLMLKGKLHVGSHNRWVKQGDNPWWQIAENTAFCQFLEHHPDLIFFGEVYGPQIQNLTYGVKKPTFRLFDVFDTSNGMYYDYDKLRMLQDEAMRWGVDSAPVVYSGPFNFQKIEELAELDSLVCPGQLMEGLVVRPRRSRYVLELDRLILKIHSQRFLLQKNG